MSEGRPLRGEHAPSMLPEARAAFSRWVRDGGSEGRTFLELHLLPVGEDRFRIRHQADRELAPGELLSLSDPYAAREIAQTTAEGAHRPLKTSPDLQRGWSLDDLDERALWIALDYLYPACAVHWYAGRTGRLRVTPWSGTAGRQSGMYSSVRLLPGEALPDVVRACCADAVCLRRVAWGRSEENPAPLAPEGDGTAGEFPGEGADVPCPEACSMFVSFARAVLRVERESRKEIPGLGSLNDLELRQIRDLVAAAASERDTPRDGEFDEPLNRRRVRYLAARLERSADDPSAA